MFKGFDFMHMVTKQEEEKPIFKLEYIVLGNRFVYVNTKY